MIQSAPQSAPSILISCQEYQELLSLKAQMQSLQADYAALAANYHALESNHKILTANYQTLESDHQYLKFQLDEFRRMVFGAKSERFVPVATDGVVQLSLFDQVPPAPQEPALAEKQTISYQREKPAPEKDKKKPVRQALPSHLKRVDEIIEPEDKPENAREIGRLETEILEYEPAQLYVHRIIRPKYVVEQPARVAQSVSAEGLPCIDPALEESPVIVAPMPPLPIPKSIAGAGLLAHICVSKFIDHLPFYRQVQMFKRQKVPIAEATLNGWFTATCRLLEPLYEALRKEILRADYLQADESPLPVLSRDHPGSTHTGYMWVYHAPVQGLVCFAYDRRRSAEAADSFLAGFQGALQTDGYAAYDHYGLKPEVTLLACMAHARRKFEHAKDSDPTRSMQMLAFFRELYALERQASQQQMSHQQRLELRRGKAVKIMDQMKQWLDRELTLALPKSPLGQAIRYTLNMWERLKGYTGHGRLEIDNNLIENSIRPVALGRKNYLFAGSHQAAQRNAMMYSFFACCKRAQVEPFEWIRDVIQRIPDQKPSRMTELLPHNWTQALHINIQ